MTPIVLIAVGDLDGLVREMNADQVLRVELQGSDVPLEFLLDRAEFVDARPVVIDSASPLGGMRLELTAARVRVGIPGGADDDQACWSSVGLC